MESEQVTFHCTATGNPTPTITWLKDGNRLAEGEKLSLTANRTHSGKYWCLADNNLDITVNTSASLDVQCKYTSVRSQLFLCRTLNKMAEFLPFKLFAHI